MPRVSELDDHAELNELSLSIGRSGAKNQPAAGRGWWAWGLISAAGQRQIVPGRLIRTVPLGAMWLAVSLTRPVVVPVAAMPTPEPPARDAAMLDLAGRDRRRVQVDAGDGVDGDFHGLPTSS